MATPTMSDTMSVRGSTTTPPAGMSTPSAEEPLFRTARHADAGDEAEERGDEADDDRLRDQTADDLAAAGADGPQQRGLALALGHDDRERVVDDEDRHEQGDAGEDQQEHVEERQALSMSDCVSLVICVAGQDLGRWR